MTTVNKSLTEQLATLPKWAQAHIEMLTREAYALRKSLAKVPRTNTRWGYGHYDTALVMGYIPDDEPIHFQFNEHQYLTVRRGEDHRLHIHGSHTLEVRPHATNAITVNIEPLFTKDVREQGPS